MGALDVEVEDIDKTRVGFPASVGQMEAETCKACFFHVIQGTKQTEQVEETQQHAAKRNKT